MQNDAFAHFWHLRGTQSQASREEKVARSDWVAAVFGMPHSKDQTSSLHQKPDSTQTKCLELRLSLLYLGKLFELRSHVRNQCKSKINSFGAPGLTTRSKKLLETRILSVLVRSFHVSFGLQERAPSSCSIRVFLAETIASIACACSLCKFCGAISFAVPSPFDFSPCYPPAGFVFYRLLTHNPPKA